MNIISLDLDKKLILSLSPPLVILYLFFFYFIIKLSVHFYYFLLSFNFPNIPRCVPHITLPLISPIKLHAM